MKKTDFFIVGAPKSGTTSLCKYLAQHPQICLSTPKEPDYFGSDLIKPEKPKTLEQYLGFFSEGNDQQKWGEGSVIYFVSQKAPQEIYQFNPQAKIIIMLREPVSLLYSLHSQLLFDLHEDITNFELALAYEEERKKGLKIPQKCRRLNLLFYSEVINFSHHVERYFETFGRKNVKVIIFDDFAKDTTNIYQEVLQFLEVDSSFRPEFKVHNTNKKIHNLALYSFFRDPPQWLFQVGRAITPPFLASLRREVIWGLINQTKTFLAPPKGRPPLNPVLKQQLQEKFAPEVKKLSNLLNRDLTYWSHH